jgi:hypothetical protein
LPIKTLQYKCFNPSWKLALDRSAEPNTTADCWHLHTKKKFSHGFIFIARNFANVCISYRSWEIFFVIRDEKTSLLFWWCKIILSFCCSLLITFILQTLSLYKEILKLWLLSILPTHSHSTMPQNWFQIDPSSKKLWQTELA